MKVIVVGLGAHGSAALHQLAKRGIDVIGIDQFHPPHSMGSSHGASRIFREAYKEGPQYIPLLRRARELWNKLNIDSGKTSFDVTGGLFMGDPSGLAITGMKLATEAYDIEVEALSPREVTYRYPIVKIPEFWQAIYEPNSATIFPETAISSQLSLASKLGAKIYFDEVLMDWSADGSGVSVKTSRDYYQADRLILCAGAWMPNLLNDLDFSLEVQRVPILMLRPRANEHLFLPDVCPNMSWELELKYPMYMQANFGTGVKIGLDPRVLEGSTTNPEDISRVVTEIDRENILEQVRIFIPDLEGEVIDSSICMYTTTPDRHFIIDRHPFRENVIISSACSGHGFKFTTVIGEILTDLASDGSSQFDLSPFAASRLLN